MMEFADVLGFLAALLTTVSFLPQVVKIVKTKSAEDISLLMFIILTTGIFLWLIYGLIITSYPIILANAVTFILVSIILIYKLRYG